MRQKATSRGGTTVLVRWLNFRMVWAFEVTWLMLFDIINTKIALTQTVNFLCNVRVFYVVHCISSTIMENDCRRHGIWCQMTWQLKYFMLGGRCARLVCAEICRDISARCLRIVCRCHCRRPSVIAYLTVSEIACMKAELHQTGRACPMEPLGKVDRGLPPASSGVT